MKTSLVILTCNRRESVCSLLENIHQQNQMPNEIIVVDNNSSDGTSDSIKTHFKKVILVRLPENMGASGRNEGIKRATGDIIVTLDDDVFFADSDGISNIKKIFRQEKEVAVLNFQILDGETKKLISFNWFHPYKMEDYANKTLITDYISEGAACFRKEVFDAVGYYPEEFFISHEGPDLAYRLLDAGYNIYYSPTIKVIHKCSTEHRVTWRNTYYDTRNQIWLAVRNLPFARAVCHVIYRLCTTFLFALRRKQLKWYFKAVFDGFRGIKYELRYRKPISKETIDKIREIRRNNPSLIYKISSFIKRTGSINEKFAK